MSIEKTGALVSRGVGVGLIILGASSILYWPQSYFVPSGLVTSGWTSYSPRTTTTTVGQPLSFSASLDSFITMLKWHLPSIGQIFAGIGMFVFSRPVGRWLASGLSDEEEEEK